MNEVDSYLNKLSDSDREALESIRAFIKELVPSATELISYNMPSFKYKGRPLFYYAAFKNHLSIFPTSKPIAELEDALKDFKVAKGTIQFSCDKPIPTDIIQSLIQNRIADIDSK